MRFEIDPGAPAPPSEQLADQVRFAVAAGRLAVGEQLPSVRELAASVRVNPNTVSRAWRELEREGILRSRRGAGMYVAEAALAICRSSRARIVAERVGRSVREALGAGFSEAEVNELMGEAAAEWRADSVDSVDSGAEDEDAA